MDDKVDGDEEIRRMTSKALLTGVDARRSDVSRQGLRAITADVGLYIGEKYVGGHPRLHHSCFHRDTMLRFAEGAGSTVFLERLRVDDLRTLAVLAHGGSSEARECMKQASKLPVDQLHNVSYAVRAMHQALSGVLKEGKSRAGKGNSDPGDRRRNLPPVVSVARAWRPDDSKRKHAHNHRTGDGFQRYGKYASWAKLYVCVHAQLIPDMAFMVVEGAYGCLVRNKIKVVTVDGAPDTPLLPNYVVSVSTRGSRVWKPGDGRHAKIEDRGCTFAGNIARDALNTLQVRVIVRVLGPVDPAVATDQYLGSVPGCVEDSGTGSELRNQKSTATRYATPLRVHHDDACKLTTLVITFVTAIVNTLATNYVCHMDGSVDARSWPCIMYTWRVHVTVTPPFPPCMMMMQIHHDAERTRLEGVESTRFVHTQKRGHRICQYLTILGWKEQGIT